MARDAARLQILKMTEARQITAKQGLERLQALQEVEGAYGPPLAGCWPRIRVTDAAIGRPRARVTVPPRWLDLGLRIGGQLAPEIARIDFQKRLEPLRASSGGKLMEVLDEEKGKRLEIKVE